MVRDTSYEAWRKINTTGLLSEKRLAVYNCVYHHGPMTAGEVFQQLGIQTNHSGRLTELRIKGVLKEVGKRPCKVTGYTSIEWDVTSGLPEDSQKPTKEQLRKEALSLIEGFIKPGMNDELLQQHRNLYKIVMKL